MKIRVRIDRMLNMDDSKIRAIASANIGDAFAIHGIKVIDSDKGPFVQMPQTSYIKNGKTKYSELFHPITADSRNELYNEILNAYDQKLQENAQEDESEGQEVGQVM